MNDSLTAQDHRFRTKRLHQVAQRNIDEGLFASIEWQVAKGGRLLNEGAVVADGLDWQLPTDPIYRIYSMTKPIVSMMGALLMERCQLNLFTPLRAILPEFATLEVLRADGTREKASPITVEQLFTHRAGFSYNFIPDCPVSELYHADGLMNDGSCSLEEFAHRAAKFPLASQPGERWHYSIATDILARVIEVVAGRPLGDLLQAEIFDPLNMTDTQFYVAESERHRLMPMYGRSLDDILKAPDAATPLKKIDVDDAYPFDRPDTFARGGHGLFSTTSDYMRFARFCITGQTAVGVPLVSRKMLDFMWANRLSDKQLPYWLGPFPSPGYGFNLMGRVMMDPGQAISLTSMGEGGWGGAAATYYWVDRAEDFTGVVMTQNLGSLTAMRTDMMAAAYQALP